MGDGEEIYDANLTVERVSAEKLSGEPFERRRRASSEKI